MTTTTNPRVHIECNQSEGDNGDRPNKVWHRFSFFFFARGRHRSEVSQNLHLNCTGRHKRMVKTSCWLKFAIFRHPALAVGSYSSGPPAARTIRTKSTGSFHHSSVLPVPTTSKCTVTTPQLIIYYNMVLLHERKSPYSPYFLLHW